ncbi:MAG: hypothetical protein NDI75_02635 [Candidatus Didemnitutus sp.]|nr:hypothetical protein [Candidatus Didemnitutus sp.]
MKIDLSSKRAQGIFAVISVCFAVLVGFGFVDFIQTQRTRDVFSAIGKANDERKKKGESLEAAEAYVVALRAIDVDYTKKELRPAFEAYVRGFEEGLALLKAGKDSASADALISAAHRDLVEIAKRYE